MRLVYMVAAGGLIAASCPGAARSEYTPRCPQAPDRQEEARKDRYFQSRTRWLSCNFIRLEERK